MSTRSSSGSWSGAGGAPPDIIDLDKFMRGAVRPPRTDAHSLRCGDKLVVDAGGVDRKPGTLGPGSPAPVGRKPGTLGPGSPAPVGRKPGALGPGAPGAAATAPASLSPSAPPVLTVPSDSSSSRARRHGKHYSHDSGLSDTSYARRKHRPHRRAVGGDSAGVRAPRTPAAGSSDSLRAFRAVCERALLDQQAQIARVAQLCERLSERPPPRRRSDRSSDTSDVSSSSRSTHDQRRKDKHRLLSSSSTNQPVCAQTDKCKTYKIIMNKLDELNRLFAARARSPPPAAPPPPRRAPASSGSVSVSDKLVATEPCVERARDLHVAHNVVTTYGACGSCGAGLAAPRAVPACALDAAPRHNVAHDRFTHSKNSVLQCESRAATGTSGGDPRCGFDLDDPVHLYSQAKRLQAMSATTRRARSLEPTAPRAERDERGERAERGEQRAARARERGGEPTLCSLCRGYWRSLTHYLAVQVFCCPDAAVH
ncbi:hypothetical protein PYW08_011069 [Mythimna loreyi]|uniref:Uncharacterized protein n=1 Tax=Mythimna loreyi TaxID=667449 RepID=A0ACC2Q2U0_9NEOP|nr:hypothetical protein PYW08_011069 [Mythimna loreyi]